MSKLNPTRVDSRFDTENTLPGGMGAAKQDAEHRLRRVVLACLLWEDLFYESGQENSESIESLIPLVNPVAVADLAIECRLQQKLRHVPLFMALEMVKYPEHKKHVQRVLEAVITRPDQITDTISLWWRSGKRPIPASVKRALATAFTKFNVYSLSKYKAKNKTVTLRDAMRLIHPKPKNSEQELAFRGLLDGTLTPPDTWEVELSKGTDQLESWTRLLKENKLGSLALLRNLNNFEKVGVNRDLVRQAINSMSSDWLLPLNFYSAYKAQGEYYSKEIENAMTRMLQTQEKIPGHTVFVIDCSGSMNQPISSKSKLLRREVAQAMAVFAAQQCDHISVYATAGDSSGHRTARIASHNGFSLIDAINSKLDGLGSNGIFTRQCLEHIKKDLNGEDVDRILVFSDSQDCDRENKVPAPFGKFNYIIDVSSHSNGINYKGVWTAEISGWSERFLDFVRAFEGLSVGEEVENTLDNSNV
jgi:60 kDa SS-A/Ro ribonucleoprotein